MRGMAPSNRRKGTRLKWGGTNNSNNSDDTIAGEGGSTPSTTTIREHHLRDRNANILFELRNNTDVDKNRLYWAIKQRTSVNVC